MKDFDLQRALLEAAFDNNNNEVGYLRISNQEEHA